MIVFKRDLHETGIFWGMAILKQYSLVCQVPGAKTYEVCAYSSTDLSKVLGITQVTMPEDYYGWILECTCRLLGI